MPEADSLPVRVRTERVALYLRYSMVCGASTIPSGIVPAKIAPVTQR